MKKEATKLTKSNVSNKKKERKDDFRWIWHTEPNINLYDSDL